LLKASIYLKYRENKSKYTVFLITDNNRQEASRRKLYRQEGKYTDKKGNIPTRKKNIPTRRGIYRQEIKYQQEEKIRTIIIDISINKYIYLSINFFFLFDFHTCSRKKVISKIILLVLVLFLLVYNNMVSIIYTKSLLKT